jgi:MarR family transcriptional regulator, organic hydroperoxide resistance regulator
MEGSAQLVDALQEWTKVFMKYAMGGFALSFKKMGISLPQIGALFQISRMGKNGVSHMGDELGVTSAAASQMLERLVQQGFVSRDEDPSDRRSKKLALTELGIRVVNESMEGRRRWFESLAERLPSDEQEIAVTGLRVLISGILEMSGTGENCPPADPGTMESRTGGGPRFDGQSTTVGHDHTVKEKRET